MATILRSLVLLPVLAVVGCEGSGGAMNPSSGDEEDLTAAGSYVAILDYWKTEADQNRWIALRQKLDQQFDAICGDTFCGGDYSNLQSLGLNCSVSKTTGRASECVWTFAGSQEGVNAKTGAVSVDAPYYLCRVSTKAFGNALLAGLEADPLRATVPGTKTTLYDVIAGCFPHPVGSTPLPAAGTGSYVEAGQDAGQDAWFTAGNALRDSFNNVCGDTFCSGDYSNLQSLRFVCSTNAKTDTLGKCEWSFTGSYDTVATATGVITSNVKRFTCPVPVKGKSAALAEALTAAGTTPAIKRTLPGTTKSAYDALGGCL